MFRAYWPILRRFHTAVHTTIGSVSVPFRPRALYVVAGLGDCFFISYAEKMHGTKSLKFVLDLCSYLSVRHCSAQMVMLLSYTPLVCSSVGVITFVIQAVISISQVFSYGDLTIKLTYKIQL
jgi:hypothetical protein